MWVDTAKNVKKFMRYYVEKALEQCETIAVFVGPSAISHWENKERRAALQMQANEASTGPRDPMVATDLNNLGSVLQDLGRPGRRQSCL